MQNKAHKRFNWLGLTWAGQEELIVTDELTDYNVEYEVKMEGWGSDPTRCCDIDILHNIRDDARTFRIYNRH